MIGPGQHPADGMLPASDGTGATIEIGYSDAERLRPPLGMRHITVTTSRKLGDGRAPTRAFGGGTAIVVNPRPPR